MAQRNELSLFQLSFLSDDEFGNHWHVPGYERSDAPLWVELCQQWFTQLDNGYHKAELVKLDWRFGLIKGNQGYAVDDDSGVLDRDNTFPEYNVIAEQNKLYKESRIWGTRQITTLMKDYLVHYHQLVQHKITNNQVDQDTQAFGQQFKMMFEEFIKPLVKTINTVCLNLHKPIAITPDNLITMERDLRSFASDLCLNNQDPRLMIADELEAAKEAVVTRFDTKTIKTEAEAKAQAAAILIRERFRADLQESVSNDSDIATVNDTLTSADVAQTVISTDETAKAASPTLDSAPEITSASNLAQPATPVASTVNLTPLATRPTTPVASVATPPTSRPVTPVITRSGLDDQRLSEVNTAFEWAATSRNTSATLLLQPKKVSPPSEFLTKNWKTLAFMTAAFLLTVVAITLVIAATHGAALPVIIAMGAAVVGHSAGTAATIAMGTALCAGAVSLAATAGAAISYGMSRIFNLGRNVFTGRVTESNPVESTPLLGTSASLSAAMRRPTPSAPRSASLLSTPVSAPIPSTPVDAATRREKANLFSPIGSLLTAGVFANALHYPPDEPSKPGSTVSSRSGTPATPHSSPSLLRRSFSSDN